MGAGGVRRASVLAGQGGDTATAWHVRAKGPECPGAVTSACLALPGIALFLVHAGHIECRQVAAKSCLAAYSVSE